MTDEEYRKCIMYRKDFDERITEYLFFRDGMTHGEFDDEQRACFEFLDRGGIFWDFIPFWKRRQEGEDV